MRTKLFFTLFSVFLFVSLQGQPQAKKRIGIIGLDTSHATTFTSMFNGADAKNEFSNYQVTIAYPWGSKTIEEGYSRVPGFIEKMKGLGVKIAGSIGELLVECDYVFLETQDGHLKVEQALEVFKAGKPVFIDKPIGASLADVYLIFELARKYKVPVFTSSSLRFIDPVVEISSGKNGKILGADCFGPCQEEPSHPTLFWYGIHGVEMLFTIMGSGCESVSRTHTFETDLVVGTWKDKRIGTYRGMRIGKGPYYHFGGFAYCEKAAVPFDKYEGFGYNNLMKETIKFFETGVAPVASETTIEIYAFMEASDLSLASGKAVIISEVISKAKIEAGKKLVNLK